MLNLHEFYFHAKSYSNNYLCRKCSVKHSIQLASVHLGSVIIELFPTVRSYHVNGFLIEYESYVRVHVQDSYFSRLERQSL